MFKKLETKTDDAFEELYFNDHECVIPSKTFANLDLHVIDSISDYDPIVVPRGC